VELTKKGHACIRLEKDDRVLVLDPGGFSEPDAAVGAHAVLITHEHPDHFDIDHLHIALDESPQTEVWTLKSVADQISGVFPGRVHTVDEGDTFTAAGFDVQVHGRLHASVHPDVPQITNVGYLVDGAIFHPGDALTVPDAQVETLLLPLHAPWSKMSEVIDYVREVGPRSALDVHDALLTPVAGDFYAGLLGPGGPGIGPAQHVRLLPGQSITL
jgi:L-ascorbate metabolism protein UlaG (beta-lactamase superfamily)